MIDRLKSIANVRTFMKIYRTTGINDERPLDISRAVGKVERYMGSRSWRSSRMIIICMKYQTGWIPGRIGGGLNSLRG